MAKKKDEGDGIGKKYGRPDLDRIGLFSEAEYITNGEKYREAKINLLEYKGIGRQFQTSPAKKGHFTKDVFFDKEFSRVLENEASTDLISLRRKWRLKAKEKNISTQPFKPSSVPPKPSGSGSRYGTIEQQFPTTNSEIDTSKFPEKPKGNPPDHKPNFLTKPPKKGSGYGYPNVAIGPPYEYKEDPYNGKHVQELKEHATHKSKVIGKPFISASARLEYFNIFAPIKAGAQHTTSKEGKTTKGAKPVFLIPFRPPSKLTECINKYPSHEAPPESKKKNEVLAMLEEEDAKKRNINPVFRPNGIPRSYPMRSIIEANCPIVAPAWIQKSWSEGYV